MCLLCNNENTILLFEDFFLLQDQGVGGMGNIPVKGVIVKVGNVHE